MTNFTATGDWTAQGTVGGVVTFTPSTGGFTIAGTIVNSTLSVSVPVISGNYVVSFSGVTLNGLMGVIQPFAFTSPTTATTVSLNTIVAPPPNVITSGQAATTTGSPPVYTTDSALISDANAYSRGFLTGADNAVDARTYLGIVGAGGVLAYSTFSAFPATGVTDQTYLAQDTDKFYVWVNGAYALTDPPAVTSAFGRTGAITAQTGDYTAVQVGAQRAGMVDVRDYIVTGSNLGPAGTVFDIQAVVNAMEALGGECYVPAGDWTANAFNIALNETLVPTGSGSVPAAAGDTPIIFVYKFRGAGHHSRILLPAGMNTGDYLFAANSTNANTFIEHPNIVMEDIGFKSSPTVPTGLSRSVNAGVLTSHQRSVAIKRVFIDRLLTGFHASGYTDLIRLEQVMLGSGMTSGCWAYQGVGLGDGCVIDQLFIPENSAGVQIGGVNINGCLGLSMRGCIGGYHQFSNCSVTFDECHFEGSSVSNSNPPTVTLEQCFADIRSGAYYSKPWRPSFSINDVGGTASRVIFHEPVAFIQLIDDTTSAMGAAKCVDVDIVAANLQTEITFKGCKSSLQYASTSVGGGSGYIARVAPLVTASGVAAIQTALTNSPLRVATDSTIRYVGSIWEIAPTNRLPIPTKTIGTPTLSAAATNAAAAFVPVTTSLAAGTYFYKMWDQDIAGRVTAASSEASATTTSGNPLPALTFNSLDDPVNVVVLRGTTTGVYDHWVTIPFTEMSQTLYDQGTYIAGQQWSSTSLPTVPAAGATQSGLLHYTSLLSEIRATAAPITGTWLTGDRCSNTNPASGPPGWVCSTGGTPGTWVATADVSSPQTLSGKTLATLVTAKSFQNLTSNGAVVIPVNTSYADVFLSANATSSTLAAGITGQMLTLFVGQDGTGGHTFSWPAATWTGGAPPVLPSAAWGFVIVTLLYDGFNWLEVSRNQDIPPSPRASSVSNVTSWTINSDTTDYAENTGLTAAVTINNPTGTPTNNQHLWVSLTGTASRAITHGTGFEASTVALPTTTSGTNRLDIEYVWNTATSKWRCVLVA